MRGLVRSRVRVRSGVRARAGMRAGMGTRAGMRAGMGTRARMRSGMGAGMRARVRMRSRVWTGVRMRTGVWPGVRMRPRVWARIRMWPGMWAGVRARPRVRGGRPGRRVGRRMRSGPWRWTGGGARRGPRRRPGSRARRRTWTAPARVAPAAGVTSATPSVTTAPPAPSGGQRWRGGQGQGYGVFDAFAGHRGRGRFLGCVGGRGGCGFNRPRKAFSWKRFAGLGAAAQRAGRGPGAGCAVDFAGVHQCSSFSHL
jgi:hypothetical protein